MGTPSRPWWRRLLTRAGAVLGGVVSLTILFALLFLPAYSGDLAGLPRAVLIAVISLVLCGVVLQLIAWVFE